MFIFLFVVTKDQSVNNKEVCQSSEILFWLVIKNIKRDREIGKKRLFLVFVRFLMDS